MLLNKIVTDSLCDSNVFIAIFSHLPLTTLN